VLAISLGMVAVAPPAAHVQASAPSVFQAVPLVHMDKPLDCESAALSSALQYQGFNAGQDWVFDQLPVDGRPPVMSGGHPVEWGNPYRAFVGNVWGNEGTSGYGVYAAPIMEAARRAGADVWGGESWSVQSLFDNLAAGRSVVVWAPIGLAYASVGSIQTWDGASVWYSQHEHAQVLAGYDTNAGTVTLMDDYSGSYRTFSISLFSQRFYAFHSTAVVVANPAHVATAKPPAANVARYWDGHGHWVTGGAVVDSFAGRPGYEERSLGMFSAHGAAPAMQQIFNCQSGAVHFLSTSSGCEGQTVLGSEGFTSTAQTSTFTVELLRCRVSSSNDHFVSIGGCEGQVTEGSLGFVSSLSALSRAFSGTEHAHWSSVGAVHSNYSPEGILGYLDTQPTTGQTPIYGCVMGTDHFTSLSSRCEGQSLVGFLGYLAAAPPAGTPSARLYRCYRNGGHFDTTSSNCEGLGAPESALGYLLTTTA
jgi:uncharacterized protein YvpB